MVKLKDNKFYSHIWVMEILIIIQVLEIVFPPMSLSLTVLSQTFQIFLVLRLLTQTYIQLIWTIQSMIKELGISLLQTLTFFSSS